MSAQEWGFKSQEEFDQQFLTPNGACVEADMGSYFFKQYEQTTESRMLFTEDADCEKLARDIFVLADNSTRDIQVALSP